MSLDVFSDEFNEDPYPHYAAIRTGAAAQLEVQPSGFVSWVVPGHDHARQVLTDERFSSDLSRCTDVENLRRGGVLNSGGSTVLGPAMVMSDPPLHTRLRGLVSRAFTPARVATMRPRVQLIADQLLDAMATMATSDLVADFAEPLPVAVICDMLGVDAGDHGEFREWLRAMLTTPKDEDDRRLREYGAGSLIRYLGGLVAARQPHLDLDRSEAEQPDLLSALIRARDGDGRLSDQELIGTMMQLLVGGYETTRNLIGNAVVALFRHPDQLQLLRQRPEFLESAIEEFLRFESPVPRAVYRLALEDVELGGTRIPAGSLVSVLIGSANRDPQRFADPDRLDITRGDRQHLAFVWGIHFCLGAALARLEGEIAIGSLLRRFPHMRLAACAPLRWRRTTIFLRGLEALPVELGQ